MREGMENIVELSWGGRVRIAPVSQMALQLADGAVGEKPSPPTRQAQAFGGAEPVPITREADLDGLEEHEDYPAWLAALRAWRADTNEWASAITEARARVILLQGVFPIDADGHGLAPEVMRGDLEALRGLGLSVEIPDHADALRVAWLRYHGLRGSDWAVVMGAVGAMTAVGPEEVLAAMRGFRYRDQRDSAARVGQPAGAEGGIQHAVHGNGSGEGGGDAAGAAGGGDEPRAAGDAAGV